MTTKAKRNEAIQTRSTLRQALLEAHTRDDSTEKDRLSVALDTIRCELIDFKIHWNSCQKQIDNYRLLHLGERESFVEFTFRSGAEYSTSWQALAEMQHHGVPTRLLDWSENLATALYFALKHYRKALYQHWYDHTRRLKSPPKATEIFDFSIPNVSGRPSIWILNPYRVSKEATGRIRIWDLTLEPDYDYFEQFVSKRHWHFEKPVPMYSPWRNPRIAAQQGMFTVFGYNREPIPKQFSTEVAIEVPLTPLAAVYAIRHLEELLSIDSFSIFRDLEALAKKVTYTFLNDGRSGLT